MKIFEIQWIKLRKYKPAYTLLGLFVLVLFILSYTFSKGVFSSSITTNGEVQTMEFVSSDYSFGKVWLNIGYNFSWAIFFVCVLVIIFITNEFRYKTSRQNVIDGLSRKEFLHSQVALIVGFNILVTFIYVALSLFFGSINGAGNVLENAIAIVYVFIYGLNYLAFAALLAILIKRSGMAIITMFSFIFFEGIITKVLSKFYNLPNAGNYFPLQCSDELFPLPVSNVVKMAMNQPALASGQTALIAISLGYVLLYYFAARKYYLSADL